MAEPGDVVGARGNGESPYVRRPSFSSAGGRQRFEVQLRPGETTIVSWKKLLKDANKAKGPIPAPEAPPIAQPPLQSRVVPGHSAEKEAEDAPPASRFSAVIEKIERLYMGKNSSDEEDLNNVPDDDEYDTEDSFIDDTELDEYFQVDNSEIKHDGFFVNRGKLERINEPAVLPNQKPKKRRRKDLAKGHGENDDGCAPTKHIKVNKKSGASLVPVLGKISANPSPSSAPANLNFEDLKHQIQSNASERSAPKQSTETKASVDQSCSRVLNGDSAAVGKDVQKTGSLLTTHHGCKSKDGSEYSLSLGQRLIDKSTYGQSKSSSERVPEELGQSVRPREKNSTRERAEMVLPENPLHNKNSLFQRKEGLSVKPKGTLLDKAIRELEKTVAESRPPSMEAFDADISSQAVKRRMPPEIKQKLARVARLAQTAHGKITKELLSRLMNILGHLVQLRTLKRNLKIMVNSGLSAKQEKEARFQQIKKEVVEMVKMRVPLMKSKAIEQQTGASDDFQETADREKEPVKRKYNIDESLEDRICDLYDLFVDGLEEDPGPQVRKLYAELAEMWPKGFMDNHGIKCAICRSKDRKKAQYSRLKDQEKMKRKKLLTSKTEDAASLAHPQIVQEKLVPHSISNGSTSLTKPSVSITTAMSTSAGVKVSGSNGPNTDRPKQGKAKGNFGNSTDGRPAAALAQKKVKRRPEPEPSETHLRSEKLALGLGEERQKSSTQIASLQKHAPLSAASAGLPSLPPAMNSSGSVL